MQRGAACKAITYILRIDLISPNFNAFRLYCAQVAISRDHRHRNGLLKQRNRFFLKLFHELEAIPLSLMDIITTSAMALSTYI